ncbi:hypothetical protein M231_03536 [Tremella mesenterica]|uniref:Uncharacterized protein n=1 Tax=Tremella mesenterica TaxID=5217 RepID=A0A4Q1BMV2_TREME|nr:uncharacterized protein TREMEDRAFT_60009 [Tremella mesenterica DSM 1558]EIW71065.1 hypothetical protein TREMEDRAFT_60009 [Tremella mesenterica DSM 1558]RXK39179.1 hypothetical protein M231_03536 [Tremella mesenterica]
MSMIDRITLPSEPPTPVSPASSAMQGRRAVTRSRSGVLVETQTPGSATSSGSGDGRSHRWRDPSGRSRSRSREAWSMLGGFMQGKTNGQTEESEDGEEEIMDMDEDVAPLTLFRAPTLPSCSLMAEFRRTSTGPPLPPAFYPGQAIPTILTFNLDRRSSLPHSLRPQLSMSLVGTLHLASKATRTIVCVSVSLQEGLTLWARDAACALRSVTSSPPPLEGLPGGIYNLPLTVQVPTTPRLPPSFRVRNAGFGVSYNLVVSLTCDSIPPTQGQSIMKRVVLAETAVPFDMLPETLPTPPVYYRPSAFYVRDFHGDDGGIVGVKGSIRRPNALWSVNISIPTAAYSPSEQIPININLTPPQEQPTGKYAEKYHIFIKASLTRREHSSISPPSPPPSSVPLPQPTKNAAGLYLIGEEEICSSWGWVESNDISTIHLPNLILPLVSSGQSWEYGFSTVLNVGNQSYVQDSTRNNQNSNGVSISSTFQINVVTAFLSLPLHSKKSKITDFIPFLPPMGIFTQPGLSPDKLKMNVMKRYFSGTIKNHSISITVGSVSEPRGAMQSTCWSELQLDRTEDGRETGTGRMVAGRSTTSENGWILPPPSYKEAVAQPPYI